jgi:hypothetical protein
MPSEIPQYPLLSESERPSAATDFIDGCLSDQHHEMITAIREISPRTYPTALSVIRTSIERLAKAAGPLPVIPTHDLVGALTTREGVEEITIAPDEGFVAANCGNDHQNMLQERKGPARILVVMDQ